MINYFDDRELERNNLKRIQNKSHPTIWYIYKGGEARSVPVRIIKEIPFENVQLYRALQYENNPNIVNIIDIARFGERVFTELEYIQGVTIGKFVEDMQRRNKAIAQKECLEIILQVCHALVTCHEIGFVHRDISENNIMLSVENESLRVRVIDFENHHWMKTGADRDTTTLGTAGYAAPEQWGFSASDASTDIYAAGILLCRLLTGEGREAIERIEDETLRYIVKRCTRMEKEERYRNVHALISDLRRAYQPYMEYQEKSSQGIADSFWQFMEEICNIDYANTFLEKPELRKEPVYMVLMISLKQISRGHPKNKEHDK